MPVVEHPPAVAADATEVVPDAEVVEAEVGADAEVVEAEVVEADVELVDEAPQAEEPAPRFRHRPRSPLPKHR